MISRFNITQPNIQTSPQKQFKEKNNNSNPNFKGLVDGLGTAALNSLNTNPAVGACFVDFFSMVMPRTLTDFSRSKDAGMETGIRESSGTINHAMAGVVGLAAGYAVSSAFNKLTGTKVHYLFTDDKALDVFGDFIGAHKDGNLINSQAYFEDMFKNMKFLNTTTDAYKNAPVGEKEAFTAMKDETAKKAAELLANAKTKAYKTPKDIMTEIKELIVGEKGASEVVELKNPKTGKTIVDSLENHINRGFSLKQAFADKVKNDAKRLEKGLGVLTDAEYISKIKILKKRTAALGLAVPVIVGMSTQPINRYLTKKRTGSDGFVGVEGREPDKSTGFKVGKTVLGIALGSAMISTILKNPAELFKPSTFTKAVKEIGSALQYRGIIPTMDQFKFIYGMTIMSRLFAVRDKNEMRESTIKDTLGFANWLILGGFVSKIAARLFNMDTLNYDDTHLDKSTLWKKIKNSAIFKGTEKSHEEIIFPALKELGIDIKDENGKVRSFRKLVAELKKQKTNAIAQKALKQLRVKNYQQLIGYVYSGLVLGLGIAKLNIAITNHVEGKNKKKLPADKMKVNNEFIKLSQQDNKTFGAFLNQI